MAERKKYGFTWQARGTFYVLADDAEDAATKAQDALDNLISTDPGQLTVTPTSITPFDQ